MKVFNVYIKSALILGLVVLFGLAPDQVEAQKCAKKTFKDRDGYVVDQNLKIGLKGSGSNTFLYVKPLSTKGDHPPLKVRFGREVTTNPDVPNESYVLPQLMANITINYDTKAKLYLANVGSIIKSIAALKGVRVYAEAVQVVNMGPGMQFLTPLTNPLGLNCKE